MNKIKDTLFDTAIIALVMVYGVLAFPYLLYNGIRHIILLKKKLRGVDFDLVTS